VKPVAWIKVRELAYMKAVEQHGKADWQTNLGLKPEPDDEGLYTETQVQQLRESFEQSITDPENQPSQYGTVPLDWHLRDEALLRQALGALECSEGLDDSMDEVITALRARLSTGDKLSPTANLTKTS
jgi:hypothetical protein